MERRIVRISVRNGNLNHPHSQDIWAQPQTVVHQTLQQCSWRMTFVPPQNICQPVPEVWYRFGNIKFKALQLLNANQDRLDGISAVLKNAHLQSLQLYPKCSNILMIVEFSLIPERWQEFKLIRNTAFQLSTNSAPVLHIFFWSLSMTACLNHSSTGQTS